MTRPIQIAQEMSLLLPTMIRHMFPYVFQPINLPPSQIIALVSIHEKGTCRLSELRKEMHVSAPTITGIADKFDRRVTNIALTAKGQGVVKEFRKNIKKRWSYVLTKLPPETRENLIHVVRKITRGFSDGVI